MEESFWVWQKNFKKYLYLEKIFPNSDLEVLF